MKHSMHHYSVNGIDCQQIGNRLYSDIDNVLSIFTMYVCFSRYVIDAVTFGQFN